MTIVEKAVQICTVLYEDDVQGPIMYEILQEEKRCNEVKITEEIKKQKKRNSGCLSSKSFQ